MEMSAIVLSVSLTCIERRKLVGDLHSHLFDCRTTRAEGIVLINNPAIICILEDHYLQHLAMAYSQLWPLLLSWT